MAQHPPNRILAGTVLVLSLAAAAGPAFLASRVDPPGNDMTLHGTLVVGAVDALRDHGWTAFQDPWVGGDNGGYPLFHVYPHLAHQCTALPAVVLGIDPWTALASGAFLAVLLLPLAVWGGGRWLGLEPVPAAFAALTAATLRSADPFGHGTLSYGFDSAGMYAQLWGMVVAPLALGAWVAAARGTGGDRWESLARAGLAALLVGAVLRTHLPTAWVLVLVAATVTAAIGPAGQLPRRLLRFSAVGLAAVILAGGFLIPFLRDLDAVALSALEHAWKLESIGAVGVLGKLVRGAYLDGVAHGPWTPLFLAALALAAVRAFGPDAVHPMLRALGVACVVSLLLLFGRETWGDWMGRLPLVGRFHDHRYLLGIHLLAPYVVALGGVEILRRWPSRLIAVRWPAVVACAVVALAAHGLATGVDAQAWRASRAPFETMEQHVGPTLDRVRDDRGRLAVVGHASSLQARRALALAQRRGLDTAGQTLHHYAPQRELALYWQGWIDGLAGFRDRPVHARDLRPLGATVLLLPPDLGGLDVDPSLAVDPVGGGWRLVRPTDDDQPTVQLVRSDLLARADRLDLQGFAVGWFLVGLPDVVQYPSIDAGVGEPLDSQRYARVVEVGDADPDLLVGLPATSSAALGRVVQSSNGPRIKERRCQVQVDRSGAWLLRHRAWHPNWRATVDGRPASVRLLCPGVVGVAVAPGSHEVVTWYHVASWRGAWAAAVTVVYLLGIVGIVGFAGRRYRLTRSA